MNSFDIDDRQPTADQAAKKGKYEGEIMTIKNGYGFIKKPPGNLFFHYQSVNGVDFNDLQVRDKITCNIEKNEEGKEVAVDCGDIRIEMC